MKRYYKRPDMNRYVACDKLFFCIVNTQSGFESINQGSVLFEERTLEYALIGAEPCTKEEFQEASNQALESIQIQFGVYGRQNLIAS